MAQNLYPLTDEQSLYNRLPHLVYTEEQLIAAQEKLIQAARRWDLLRKVKARGDLRALKKDVKKLYYYITRAIENHFLDNSFVMPFVKSTLIIFDWDFQLDVTFSGDRLEKAERFLKYAKDVNDIFNNLTFIDWEEIADSIPGEFFQDPEESACFKRYKRIFLVDYEVVTPTLNELFS